MYAKRPRTSLTALCAAMGLICLIAPLSLPEEKTALPTPFARLGFDKGPDSQVSAFSQVFEDLKFPQFSVRLSSNGFDVSFDDELEKLHEVVPLGTLSKAECQPTKSVLVRSIDGLGFEELEDPSRIMIDINWIPGSPRHAPNPTF